jgi:hypothetical protein
LAIALLAATAGAAEQQLSKDQEDACGAILCLAGGGGVGECAPYLARFYGVDKPDRKEFLEKCPDSGLSSGALAELAAYGQNCQPDKLDDYLNQRMCTAEKKERGLACRDPSPEDWKALCGSFYAELTDEEPPKLIERCRNERDLSGSMAPVCSQWWVSADYATGSWCKDQEAGCEEREVSRATNRPLARR